MKPALIDLIDPYDAVSIIGMAKNVGKTTTLNKLIKCFGKRGDVIGLTSIGRDGESVDVVTSTDKPEIYVMKGTIVATTSDLLKQCDITKEIVLTTGINTPLGEVVLVRALSDGYVQLSGASINSQIAGMCAQFKELGAGKILVDGAISRKTLSSPSITDATILCTGASLHVDMDKVITETAHAVNMLMLPRLADETAYALLNTLAPHERAVLIYADYTHKPLNLDEVAAARQDLVYIYFRGAVSDNMLTKLIMANINMKNVLLIVDDSSKLFLKETTYEKLRRKEADIVVLHKINVIAMTINPVSAYGVHYDKAVFMEKMSEKVTIPVYNVQEEG